MKSIAFAAVPCNARAAHPTSRMECLRHIRDVFGVTFKIKPDPETKTVLVSCLGVGYTNYAKKVT